MLTRLSTTLAVTLTLAAGSLLAEGEASFDLITVDDHFWELTNEQNVPEEEGTVVESRAVRSVHWTLNAEPLTTVKVKFLHLGSRKPNSFIRFDMGMAGFKNLHELATLAMQTQSTMELSIHTEDKAVHTYVLATDELDEAVSRIITKMASILEGMDLSNYSPEMTARGLAIPTEALIPFIQAIASEYKGAEEV